MTPRHGPGRQLLLLIALSCIAGAQEPPGPYLSGEYLDRAQVVERLERLAEEHPERLTLTTLARSRRGAPVLLATATTAAPEDRHLQPATLVVGGLRPEGETGMYVALELLERLARGADEQVEELLATRVLHIVPLLNPDLLGSTLPYGAEGRLNGEPLDDDRDRRVDEDSARDLDGDGQVLTMRVPDPAGDWCVAPDSLDPTDRRLLRRVRADQGEIGEYRLEPEGADADDDGRRTEDGPGGIDLAAQFPAFWKPPHELDGAGPAPLWEPEPRGLVDFLLAHPQVSTAYVLGGTGGEVLVPPRGADPDDVPGADRELLQRFATDLQECAGLARVRPAVEESRRGGSLLDWLYWEHGALPLHVCPWGVPGDELEAIETGLRTQQEEKREQALQEALTEAREAQGDALDEPAFREVWQQEHPVPEPAGDPEHDRAWLRWCSRHAPEGGYRDWQPFPHPQLGPVEIGGWLPVGRDRPPPDRLPVLARTVADAILVTCGRSPQLVLEATVTRVDSKVEAVYRIEARAGNVGDLPTATSRSRTARSTLQVSLRLEAQGGAPEYLLGLPLQRVGHLDPGDWSDRAHWLVQLPLEARAWLVATSQRGGGCRQLVIPTPEDR